MMMEMSFVWLVVGMLMVTMLVGIFVKLYTATSYHFDHWIAYFCCFLDFYGFYRFCLIVMELLLFFSFYYIYIYNWFFSYFSLVFIPL